MNRPSEKEFKNSLFFKWILNNQAVIALMITFFGIFNDFYFYQNLFYV